MKLLIRSLIYALIVVAVVIINSLFFLHHPPEVQLAFITPGVIILGYSLISDDMKKKSKLRWIRER